MSAETRGSLGEGAAEGAPTAPHATPHQVSGAPRTRSGPERFWDRKRARRAFLAAALLSTGAHYMMSPWTLMPEHRLELREVDGELLIPIEAFDQAPTPPPPPPEAPAPPPAADPNADGIGSTKRDAGPKPRDAGRDAIADAAPDAPRDAARDVDLDAPDLDAGPMPLSDGAVASAENVEAGAAGPPGASGPRNPSDFIGAAGDIQPGIPNVQVFVNVAEVRKSALGPDIGKFFSLIPEWDSFIAGTNVDPVQDGEWMYLFGPSLYTKRSSKVAVIIRYNATDAKIDRALDVVSKKYTGGGPYDAGVPGVKAYLGHADFAQRVFLRPQSHLLAVVPPDYATPFAKALSKGKIDMKSRKGEVARIAVRDPGRPMPFLPATIKEMRIWATPRDDGGLDIFGEADAPDAAEAVSAAKQIDKVIKEQARSIIIRSVTDGALDHAEVTPDGSLVRLKLPVTGEQIKTMMSFVAGSTGVEPKK